MFSSSEGKPSVRNDVRGHTSLPSAAPQNLVAASSQIGCMVVGFDEARRRQLASAAGIAGWGTVECSDPKSARIQLLREPQQMVVIDLEDASGSAPDPLKSLAERTSKQKGVLLALCGNEGNAMEEIWARQLGVWLYLPGVVDDSDLSSLFEEGCTIAAWRRAVTDRQSYFPDRNVATA